MKIHRLGIVYYHTLYELYLCIEKNLSKFFANQIKRRAVTRLSFEFRLLKLQNSFFPIKKKPTSWKMSICVFNGFFIIQRALDLINFVAPFGHLVVIFMTFSLAINEWQLIRCWYRLWSCLFLSFSFFELIFS